jgi:hypothetical protein
MVAFTAWSQWQDARHLTSEIEKLLGGNNQREGKAAKTTEDDLEMNVQTMLNLDDEIKSNQETDHGEDHVRVNPRRIHAWTNTHSFYAVMGGFVFDTSNLPPDQKFLPGKHDRVTLSPQALIFVAKHEPLLLPDLSQAEMLDKSKANHLAKGIVCLSSSVVHSANNISPRPGPGHQSTRVEYLCPYDLRPTDLLLLVG